MAHNVGQRLRILYIKDYLEHNSNPEHPITAQSILDDLEEKGIQCDRKTVYQDIQSLIDYGMSIETTRGKNGGYYVESSTFELQELKLLIDTVQSARFLTVRKCNELIRKLLTLCSRHEKSLLGRTMMVTDRVKSMNESIYYNLDSIQAAIAEGKQITFRYFSWDVGHVERFKDKQYSASPYALLQDSGNYYLLAHTQEHGVTHYRVDHMKDIRPSQLKRTACPELSRDALKNYNKKVFQMYSGEERNVKLRMKRHLAGVVYDRFGQDAMLIPDGDDWFTFTTNVEVSPTFMGWILGFGTECEVAYPEDVRQSVKNFCGSVLELYKN